MPFVLTVTNKSVALRPSLALTPSGAELRFGSAALFIRPGTPSRRFVLVFFISLRALLLCLGESRNINKGQNENTGIRRKLTNNFAETI